MKEETFHVCVNTSSGGPRKSFSIFSFVLNQLICENDVMEADVAWILVLKLGSDNGYANE